MTTALHDAGRINYVSVDDEETMEAFSKAQPSEGIIPAVESSHALAYGIRYAREHRNGSILVNLSRRGDKDMDFVIGKYGLGERFLTDLY